MKILEIPQIIRIVPVSLFTTLIFAAPAGVSALSVSSGRDCDGNAVINCGALSVNELQQKYSEQQSVHSIYHNFGITHIDIANMDSTAVEGKVTVGGRVLVNGNEVANNAVTAGRQDIPGSGKQTANGVTFYTRPPSVSFQQNSLPAFVVMKDGQFQFAIIASCGNPVRANAVVKKQTSKPAPVAKVTPPPAPPAQVQVQQQSVTVTAAPAPKPTPAPAPATQPKALPSTGISDIAGFGSFVSLLAAGAHVLYKKKLLGL
jgi:hypothetical protein